MILLLSGEDQKWPAYCLLTAFEIRYLDFCGYAFNGAYIVPKESMKGQGEIEKIYKSLILRGCG